MYKDKNEGILFVLLPAVQILIIFQIREVICIVKINKKLIFQGFLLDRVKKHPIYFDKLISRESPLTILNLIP